MSTPARTFPALLLTGLAIVCGASPAAAQLAVAGSYVLRQGVVNAGSAEEADLFGDAVASGDFNGDGFADLAVGVPGESVGGADAAGAAQVFLGAPGGLDGSADRLFHQDSPAIGSEPAIAGIAEANDRFGQTLAVGDFDGDGFDDLAIGAPGEDIDSISNAGAIWIFFGSGNGLTATGHQMRHQGPPGFSSWEESPEAGDQFGYALAAGDFNGDGFDELAVGVPFEDLFFGPTDAGTVHVYLGPTLVPVVTYTQGSADPSDGPFDPTPSETPENGDFYGYALASGDFDGDGRDDLAVGARGEDLDGLDSAGIVEVLFGSDLIVAFDVDRHALLHQDRAGTPGAVEANDFFGSRLAVGDFDADGEDDLVVGVALEAIGSVSDAGAVSIFFGPFPELSSLRAQFFSQNDPAAIGGVAEAHDRFGAALATGDLDDDGFDDLAVGVPDEDLGATSNSGAFQILYGGASGLGAARNQIFDQDSPGVPNSAEAGDRLGGALAAGDFDRDGVADLAVGCATEELAGEATDHGVVMVFSGARP